MKRKVVPVIMAGGKGTRLWPLSRSRAPKQFIKIVNDQTLFQKTLERVRNLDLYEPAIVVTNEQFRFLVAEQAREIEIELSAIILEPIARNTAAAAAAAAAVVSRRYGANSIMQLLASDHDIEVEEKYDDAIRAALFAAERGKLVTFGIRPTEPATGYGYIEVGERIFDGAHAVKRFVEKPIRPAAVEMLATGKFVWNSGMFMFPVDVLISEIQAFAPEVLNAVEQSLAAMTEDIDFVRLDMDTFAQSPDISIDYAVMEKTKNAVVVPSYFHWSDLGSWDQIWKAEKKDPDGNVAIGEATLVGTKNSLVISRSVHLAVQGMHDVAVIASEDAVYIGNLSDSQDVGSVVKRLADRESTSTLTKNHRTSYRPWGGYTSMAVGQRFQVKRLFVLPGKRISLQKHHHRSEHWVVVSGTAEVTLGETSQLLFENQSIYIPVGSMHRLANPGKVLLELIEVQTGSYLGEDDIIRNADDYGRQ